MPSDAGVGTKQKGVAVSPVSGDTHNASASRSVSCCVSLSLLGPTPVVPGVGASLQTVADGIIGTEQFGIYSANGRSVSA